MTTSVSDAHNLSTRCTLHVAFHDTFFRFGVGLCKVLYHFWAWAPLKQASTVIEPVPKRESGLSCPFLTYNALAFYLLCMTIGTLNLLGVYLVVKYIVASTLLPKETTIYRFIIA